MHTMMSYDEYRKLEIGDRVGFYFTKPPTEEVVYMGIGVVVVPCNDRGELHVQVLYFLTEPPVNEFLNQNIVVAGRFLFTCTDKMGAMVRSVDQSLQANQGVYWHKPAWPGEAQAWARVIRVNADDTVIISVVGLIKPMWLFNPQIGATVCVPKFQLRLPVL